jgi:hypothetical protein
MDNLWLEWLIDKFITEETDIRCCGSCQGGCINPAVCFLCCGYNQKTLEVYIRDRKEELQAEFEAYLYKDYDGGKE